MVVGAGGVLLAGVFVRDVVGADRTIVGVRAIAAVIAIAAGNRIADRHGPDPIALAAVLFVDLAAGHAADHRADRRSRITRTATTDLAADRRTHDAADNRRDRSTGLRSAIAAVAVLIVVAVVAIAVIAVAVAITAVVIAVIAAHVGVAVIAALRI